MDDQRKAEAMIEVVERLRSVGGRVWLVGGALRDLLRRRPGFAEERPPLPVLSTELEPSEIDLATDLTPDVVGRAFPGAPEVGRRFGTVLVQHGGGVFEVTTLRGEGGYSDGRRPDEVRFGVSIEEDLARRDFTVNALALELPEGELLDPFGGLSDLRRGVLRAVGDPERRLAEDGLRAYRACRFAATLELGPTVDLRRALRDNAAVARGVAWERIGAELNKALDAERPGVCFELLRRVGLLEHCLPELANCYGVTQGGRHELDVYDHSLLTCDRAPRDKPVVRWAALLHDVGKPAARRERGRRLIFHGHDELSAKLAERALRRLKLPGELRRRVVHLVRRHMFLYTPEWGDAAVRRFVRRIGVGNLADLFDLVIADRSAHRRDELYAPPADIVTLMKRIEGLGVAGAALELGDLAIDGRDLLRLTGREPGPWVGRLLERLLEEVLEDPELNTSDVLLQRAGELLAEEESLD
jgi:putative nucleotidyltransferase with HDIG domain